MSKDIWRYLSNYLEHCRNNRPQGEDIQTDHIPPTGREVQDLISYLKNKGLEPVIVGSVAVIKHLNLASNDFNSGDFRNTQDLDIFVSQQLPSPPPGWSRDMASIGLTSWISPSGGYVDFLVAGHIFPDRHRNPQKVVKDPESASMGCPLADVVSIFKMKLNSNRTKDLTDLVAIACRIGITKDLEKEPLNSTQKENLEAVKLWVEHGAEE